VGVSPFGRIDNDAAGGGTLNESRPSECVTNQLQAFRRWSMDGTFSIFASNPLDKFDYTPYVEAMRAFRLAADQERTQLTAGDPKLRTGPRAEDHRSAPGLCCRSLRGPCRVLARCCKR
jgi:hypothetical protein